MKYDTRNENIFANLPPGGLVSSPLTLQPTWYSLMKNKAMPLRELDNWHQAATLQVSPENGRDLGE